MKLAGPLLERLHRHFDAMKKKILLKTHRLKKRTNLPEAMCPWVIEMHICVWCSFDSFKFNNTGFGIPESSESVYQSDRRFLN